MFLYFLLTLAASRNNLKLDLDNLSLKSTNGLFTNYDLMNKKTRNTDNILSLKEYIKNYKAKEFFTKAYAEFKSILKILSDLNDDKLLFFDDCKFKKIIFEKTLRKITINIFEKLFINPNIHNIRLIFNFPSDKLIFKEDKILDTTFNYFVSTVFNLNEGKSTSRFYDVVQDKYDLSADKPLYNSICKAYCDIIDVVENQLKK